MTKNIYWQTVFSLFFTKTKKILKLTLHFLNKFIHSKTQCSFKCDNQLKLRFCAFVCEHCDFYRIIEFKIGI